MKRLHSPWRSEYIQTFTGPKTKKRCVFCEAIRSRNDEKHFVVARGKSCFLILNLYPYNSGHCLVVPRRHVGSLGDLTTRESTEMFALIRKTVAGLERVAGPDGFNIGSNLGRTAGAGIDDHIHFHVVPRWNGDTNFMPVLTGTKVISEDMKQTWKKLKKALAAR
jgi:ATP adenylyltransferase